MTQTELASWYQRQNASILAEKVEMLKNRRLIVEALEQDDLERADAAIKHIKGVLSDTWDLLPELQQGVAEAREQLADAVNGIDTEFSDFASFKDNIISKAGAQISQQLMNSLSFLMTVTIGLRNLETAASSITVTYKRNGKMQKARLIDLKGGRDVRLTDLEASLEESGANIDLKRVQASILRSMRPKGMMNLLNKALGRSSIPFVDDQRMVAEFMNLSLDDMLQISKRAKNVPLPSDEADLKALSVTSSKSVEQERRDVVMSKAEEKIKNMSDAKKAALIGLLSKHPPKTKKQKKAKKKKRVRIATETDQ